MGTYDKKLKNADFSLVTVSFVHIESRVIPLLKALIKIFISFSHIDEMWEN